MKVLICGSRGWKDPHPIEAILAGYDILAQETGDEVILIHGDAKSGADAIANQIAKRWGFKTIRVPAQWDEYGKAAGVIRNQQMIDEHQPDVVYAFRAYGKSNGTDDMVKRSEKARITTFVVHGGQHD